MVRLLRGGLAAALALFLLLWCAVPALAADWTDFGGTPERQHRSTEDWTVPGDEWWHVLAWVGTSPSQPLLVGGKLYHIAANPQGVPWKGVPPGAWLYRYDLASLPLGGPDYVLDGWLPEYRVARQNNDPNEFGWSHGHLTYDPATGGFYWGTADGCLAAWKPGMSEPVFQPLYRKVPGDVRVVSAPLVLSPDVVALGTAPMPGTRGPGGVWVVSGMLTSGTSRAVWDWIPAAVTSSFVKVTADRFLVGVDAIGGRGEVRCYQVGSRGLELVTSWGNNGRILTPAGVPASFAVEGPYFYFSDKYGTFYKAELRTGQVVWARRFDSIRALAWPLALEPSPEGRAEMLAWNYSVGPKAIDVRGDRLFINSSPAVGDRFAYFTVRTVDYTASDWPYGLLVALDKGTGDLAWAVRLAGRGQICPLVWEKARRVLVGDDEGYLTCWDADTGKPRALSVRREQAGAPDPVAYVELGGVFWPDRPVQKWQQVGGASVELALADGYLVAGGSWTDVGSAPTGALGVLRLAPPLNLRMKEAIREPSGPVEPGKQVTVRATVELAQGEVPVDTWVGWRWKGESEWRKVQDLTLGPETREATVSFPVTAPQATQTLEVKVNPDELHPATETDYRDNAAEVLVEVKEPPPPLDIALSLLYPKELWSGMAVKVWVETWVAQGQGVTTDVVFTVNGQSASKRVTLRGGRPGPVERTEFWLEAFEPGTLHLKAVVNPRRDPPEVRYDNNSFEVDVPVYYWSQGRKGTGVRVWLSK